MSRPEIPSVVVAPPFFEAREENGMVGHDVFEVVAELVIGCAGDDHRCRNPFGCGTLHSDCAQIILACRYGHVDGRLLHVEA